MADFAPNFTFRYRVRYSTLGHEHSMLWRFARGTTAAALANITALWQSFMNNTQASRYVGWSVLSAEYSLEDTSIFLTAPTPLLLPATLAVGANIVSQSTMSLSFIGRSAGGHKAKFFLYGTGYAPEDFTVPADNFRIQDADDAALAGARGALVGGTPQLVANDNLPIFWYPYFNVKYNDYWVRQVRG